MNWTSLYYSFMHDRRFLLALMAEGYAAATQSGRDDVAFNLTANSYDPYALFSVLDVWGIRVTEAAARRVARYEANRMSRRINLDSITGL